MKKRAEKQQIFVNGAKGHSGLRRIERAAAAIAAALIVVTAVRCAAVKARRPAFCFRQMEQTSSETEGAKLDLNTATAEELEGLPGIGPVLAERITAWREENGAFTGKEDVLAVDGIGPGVWESIEPYVTY